MRRNILEYIAKLCYSIIKEYIKKDGDTMARINNKLEKEANTILVKNDMLRLPVDLIAIANNNDIEVYRAELPDGISGAIKYNQDSQKFQILVDKNEPYSRQRFTLAHELAHFFLEKEKLLCNQEIHFDVLYRRNKNPGEEDVEYLASALLMDKIMLTKLYNICPYISVLAKTFEVSESAMTIRLSKLGLL